MKPEGDIGVLLLGASVGSYAVARSFYADFDIRPCVMDRSLPPFFSLSAFLSAQRLPGQGDVPDALLLRILEDYITDKERRGVKRSLLLPTASWALPFIQRQRASLERLFILPYEGTECLPVWQTPEGSPVGALSIYADGKGNAMAVYAERVGLLENGLPLAFLTKEGVPPALVGDVDRVAGCGARGIFYADVYQKGDRLCPGALCEDLSAPAFFADGADVSFAELLLRQYIAVSTLPKVQAYPGLYRIAPFSAVRRRLAGTEQEKEFLSLHARGWEIGLLDGKGEKRDPRALAARRAYALSVAP